MTFKAYQYEAKQTAIYPNQGNNLDYPTLGLASEVGEIAGHISKLHRDDNGILSDERKGSLIKEIGDVLWFVATLCTELEVDMGELAHTNILKLRDRQKRNVLKGDGDNR